MELTSRRKIKPATRGIRAARSAFHHHKSGAHAESLRVVSRVQAEVISLLDREPEPEGEGEGGGRREKHRVLHRFKKDLHKLVGGLSRFIPEDNATMDTLQHAMFDVDDAANAYGAALDDDGALDVPDARAFAKHVAVSKLAAIRGLDSKDAYAAFLKHVDVVAEWRRERAAWREERRKGYTDRKGVKRSAGDLAANAERVRQRCADPTGRDVALSLRLSETGRGLQDEASTETSIRAQQERMRTWQRRHPHRQGDTIDAAHAARNALPPPRGAKRTQDGYVVRAYIAQGQPQRATWSRDEIERRVAELREKNGVREMDMSAYGKYVTESSSGWRVEPPIAELRKLRVKEKYIYNRATRSCKFPNKAEADTAYEKFMAPSTSDDVRKAMMRPPLDAYYCAHCQRGFFRGKHTGQRIKSRQLHERSCPKKSSSSSVDESEDEETEEDEPEEVVAPPPPKRMRLPWSLGLW